ncbi:hypothetical protein [Roseococcus pinisoli]|uniref:Uncharacterized protein n=1 Tax=Roseococcus pinisoli TaxID=2835040 RepID=A0ABS5QFE5_9PROT|nr:hypothetical protein [Roseococcus pinisoli]MBS7812267.1 hypothetical protein [Roseococcus pinisoli]
MSAATPWDGVPLRADVDGWHVVDGQPFGWIASLQNWKDHAGRFLSAKVFAGRVYAGPVRTDADLGAASAAGALAMREACAQVVEDNPVAGMAWSTQHERLVKVTPGMTPHELIAATRALPIPDAPALATALEQARREEREACARIVEARAAAYDNEHGIYDHSTGVTEYPGNGDEWMEEWGSIAGTIRARTPTTGEQAEGGA